MSNCLPQPPKRNDLRSSVIICPSQTILNLFKSKLKDLKTNKPIADCFSVQSNEEFTLIGPVLGAPAIGIVLEQLRVSNVKSVFFLGLAGGLLSSVPELKIGDIIFPRGAISEEGTSKLYGASESIYFEAANTQLEIEKRLANTTSTHQGLIWSTDAPYRETAEKVDFYASKKAIAVEMEFAALLHLSNLYNLELSACFVVSDLLSDTWQPGFSNNRVKESLELIVKNFLNS